MKKLSELCCEIIDCVNKTAPESADVTPFKMLRTSNIRNGTIDYENVKFVSRETYVKWTRRGKLKKGDIIFTREAPLGEVGMIERDDGYFLGQRLVLFRTDETCCYNRFLLYALQFHDVKAAITSSGVGATVVHMRVPECANISVPCPSLSLQKKIGDILYQYDALIENNRRQIKLLEEAAQRLYKEWFVDLRFPGHEHTPITNGVPQGWRPMLMEDVCKTIGGGTPSTKRPEYYEKGTIPWVTPTDVTRNGSLVLLSPEKYITQEGLDNSSAKMVHPFTILMTSRASVGFFAVCSQSVCTNQGFIACEPKEGVTRMFLLFHLLSRVPEIRIKAGGSTYPEISKGTFRQLPLLLPAPHVMRGFDDIVFPIILLVEKLSQEILRLTEARDRLLPKLMSGEIEAPALS